MASPKLSRLELQIMETLWSRGNASIREIQESFPEKDRPAYATIQTIVWKRRRPFIAPGRSETSTSSNQRSLETPRNANSSMNCSRYLADAPSL